MSTELQFPGERTLLAGRKDDSRDRFDDIAADKALNQIVHEGWFVCKQKASFDCISYWDTPEKMRGYIEEKGSSLVLPEKVLAEVHRLLTHRGNQAKLRIPFEMVIARYRKLL